MAKKKEGGLGEALRTIIYAVILALFVRTFGYEPFSIPSGSMIPTLLVGDYLFVSKFAYGYSRYSLPFSLPLFSGRVLGEEPVQGDVVVFKLPSDNETDYIKRLIGLPGDRIQVIDNVLHINGEPVKKEYLRTVEQEGFLGYKIRVREYLETLPNGVQHLIWEHESKPSETTPEYLVPPEHFFFMGDNRDSSQDSRVLSIVGYVPYVNLVGKAEFLFFSNDGAAPIWQIWRWPTSVRWSRIGDSID
ncbi:MAG: signal peptidase I [Pseudomonadota bacterium]